MSSQYFEDLEDEIKQLIEDTGRLLDVTLPKLRGDSRAGTVKSIERKCSDIDSIIREMMVEVRTAPSTYQLSMQSRVDKYKMAIGDLRRKLTSSTRPSERSELLKTPGKSVQFEDYMGQVERNTHVARSTSETLARTQAVAADTDNVCEDVMGTLHDQREQLVTTRRRMTDMNSDLNESQRLLTKIACSAVKNKILVAVVIIIQILVLGGLIYWKFFS